MIQIIFVVVLCFLTATVYGASAPNLGTCSGFALHGHAGVAAASDKTVIYGNVGGDAAITGFGPAPLPRTATTYSIYQSTDGPSITCASDKGTAYQASNAQHCNNLLPSPALSGLTLSPGVYCTGAGLFTLTAGALTLDGGVAGGGASTGVWIFQAATTVSTSTNTQIILVNGAQAQNVFWVAGTSVVLADTSSFVGTILAGASVSLGSSTVLTGRALASTGSVTLAGQDTVTLPA